MKKHCTLQTFAAVLSLLPLLAVAMPVVDRGVPQQTTKTVSWYADHPQQRAQTQLACMDDPGHQANNPDCVNAQQASVEVALRSVRARTSALLNPRDPAFWSADPQTRRNKLLMCRLNPKLDFCDVAKRSLQIEAGQIKR